MSVAEKQSVAPESGEIRDFHSERWFSEVLLKCSDRVNEIVANLEAGDVENSPTIEAVFHLLGDLGQELWKARWELGLGGGDERIRVTKGGAS